MLETRISRFLVLKEYEDQLLGQIEMIVRVDQFDRKRANLAKEKIKSAVQILTQDVDMSKVLPESALTSILSLVCEMGKKGRQKIFLEVAEDESGVKDIITGKSWEFKK
jgi:hypothetical protein